MPSASVHRSKTRLSSRMSHDIENEISRLADGIAALRVVYALIQGRPPMPPLIEIKGLSATVAAAKRGIADVRAATSGLSAEAGHLVSAVNDVRAQIKQAHDDLKFEAETLGNGGETISDTEPASQEVLQDGATFRIPG